MGDNWAITAGISKIIIYPIVRPPASLKAEREWAGYAGTERIDGQILLGQRGYMGWIYWDRKDK